MKKCLFAVAIATSFCFGLLTSPLVHLTTAHAASNTPQYKVEYVNNAGGLLGVGSNEAIEQLLNEKAAHGWYLMRTQMMAGERVLYIFTNVAPRQ
jgi:hypothetical protein